MGFSPDGRVFVSRIEDSTLTGLYGHLMRNPSFSTAVSDQGGRCYAQLINVSKPERLHAYVICRVYRELLGLRPRENVRS